MRDTSEWHYTFSLNGLPIIVMNVKKYIQITS
jgi:hypothetical protein